MKGRRARRTAGGMTGFGGPMRRRSPAFVRGEGQGVDAGLRSVARPPWIAVVYKPRISRPRSARTAAIWATSLSDGFASSLYRRRYLSVARSYFGSPLSAYKLHELTGLRERDERDLERGLLGAGDWVRKGVRAPKGPRPRFLLRQSFARYRPGIGAAGYGISGSRSRGLGNPTRGRQPYDWSSKDVSLRSWAGRRKSGAARLSPRGGRQDLACPTRVRSLGS